MIILWIMMILFLILPQLCVGSYRFGNNSLTNHIKRTPIQAMNVRETLHIVDSPGAVLQSCHHVLDSSSSQWSTLWQPLILRLEMKSSIKRSLAFSDFKDRVISANIDKS